MRLEEAVELLAGAPPIDLLVMELATGRERTIDGIANGREIVLGHPKTREAMSAGLAMYFVTLDDGGLMELAGASSRSSAIEHFFNIQLVGESGDRDQSADLNRSSTRTTSTCPTSGLKRALGEISDSELAALAAASGPGGRRCATSTSSSSMR